MEPEDNTKQEPGPADEPGAGPNLDQDWLGNPARRASHSSDWTAVLGRLGGSSPGSEENLQLAETFAGVHFPATPEDVLRCLPPVSEFRVRKVAVDLRRAIAGSRAPAFQNANDLIDAVKDEIRRAEKREAKRT